MSDLDDSAATDPEIPSLTRARAVLDWWDAWAAAWDALESYSLVDAADSRQYCRLSAAALKSGIPGCQTALRRWILDSVGAGPADSITAQSLRDRESRRGS